MNFNSRIYRVQCWDGIVRDYAANVIAENIVNQADNNEHFSCNLAYIEDHRHDEDAI